MLDSIYHITVQNFGHKFPIDIRIARTDYKLYDSIKNFTH